MIHVPIGCLVHTVNCILGQKKLFLAMSSLKRRLGALGWATRPPANPTPSFLANSAIDVVTFLVRTPLKVVALNFLRIASATSGCSAAVRTSLETH